MATSAELRILMPNRLELVRLCARLAKVKSLLDGYEREGIGEIDAVGDGVVAGDFEEFDFDADLGSRRSQVFEHEARGDDLGDAVAQDHAVVLGVEGDLLNGEGLLHGGDDGIEVLRVGGFGEVQLDGDGRFTFGAFLRSVLDYQKDSLGEGDEKGAGGGFEAVEGVAVVGVRHLETEAGARLKVVVEDAIEAEGLGDFFKQRFGVAVQVESLAAGLGFEFDGGEEFAGFHAVVGGGVGEGRRGGWRRRRRWGRRGRRWPASL